MEQIVFQHYSHSSAVMERHAVPAPFGNVLNHFICLIYFCFSSQLREGLICFHVSVVGIDFLCWEFSRCCAYLWCLGLGCGTFNRWRARRGGWYWHSALRWPYLTTSDRFIRRSPFRRARVRSNDFTASCCPSFRPPRNTRRCRTPKRGRDRNICEMINLQLSL